jgi:hypothetical protein
MSFLSDLPCFTTSSEVVVEQKKITRAGSPVKVIKLKKVTYIAQHETSPPQHQGKRKMFSILDPSEKNQVHQLLRSYLFIKILEIIRVLMFNLQS